MELHKLRSQKQCQHILQIDPTTRITCSPNPSDNPAVYYERLTENQAKLTVGKYCSIAIRTHFYLGGNHNLNRISTWLPDPGMACDRSRDVMTKGDIRIENDVWIADGATILSGVTIGTGAVIGCYSVVTHDVEPYSIVVGNPGRAVKKRFSDDEIAVLLKSEWWNWSHEKVKSNSHIIFGESFPDFQRLVDQTTV